MSLTFSFPFVATPSFYSGTSLSTLVPDVFPVGIDGRPFLIDQGSDRFTRQFEQRVRDSVDQSTAPGEAAINPGGLWRRGEVSWHLGSGQKYADTAEAQDYRMLSSKGVNPWVKGQLSLLNNTILRFPSTAINLKMLEVDDYLYVADGNFLRFSTTPFAAEKTAAISTVSGNGTTMSYTTTTAHGFSAGDVVTVTGVSPAGYNVTKGTIATIVSTTEFTVAGTESGVYVSGGSATSFPWKTVTGSPAELINDITTDGSQVYVAYEDEGILMTTIGGASLTAHYATSGGTYNYTRLGFAKGFVLGFHKEGTSESHIHVVPFEDDTSHGTAIAELRDPNFVCAGFAGGQNHIYVAGRSSDTGIIYRLGIKADGTVDVAIVALELPIGEYPTSIFGYLGAILIGTNKGVRYTTPDNAGNLVAGALIPTSGDVNGFTAEDRFVWFTWSNYDNVSGGLGRLDLANFVSANTPAHATDLMYDSTVAVKSVVSLNNKRVFSISGVGVVVEDSANLVASGSVESGVYRWGIPDPKFIARVDTRALPLTGTIESYMSLDNSDFSLLGTWITPGDTENSFNGSNNRIIEAKFKFVLNRESALVGPIFTRWTARAYAAPFRSELFRIPVILHEQIRVRDKDYFFDVNEELKQLRTLINEPRVVTLQLGDETVSVIMEDMDWTPRDSRDRSWIWEGTAVVTMRSVQE